MPPSASTAINDLPGLLEALPQGVLGVAIAGTGEEAELCLRDGAGAEEAP